MDSADNTPEQSESIYPPPDLGFEQLEQFNALAQHRARELQRSNAQAQQGHRSRVPTSEVLPSDCKKPVRHQRTDFSLADYLFKWEGLLHTKDPLMGNLGQN